MKSKWSLFDVKKYFQLLRFQTDLTIKFCTCNLRKDLLVIFIEKNKYIFHLTVVKPNSLSCVIGLFKTYLFVYMHKYAITLQPEAQRTIYYV